MDPKTIRFNPRLLPVLLAAILSVGCAALVEDVATDLTTHHQQTLAQDVTVVAGDLALFRTCLNKRGGSCQGAATTPLPHTTASDHGQKAAPVTPVNPGGSQTLKDSVAALPAGHPAKNAHALLSHTMTQQTAALHDAVRAHEPSGMTGVTVQQTTTPTGGKQSTITMDVQMPHAHDFHRRLLHSIGDGSWGRLHRHCQALLKANLEDSDSHLAADCRKVAFIKGYLEAYLRHSEFLRVDVDAAGLIHKVQHEGAAIQSDIQRLRDRLAALEAGVHQAETQTQARLAADATHLVSRLNALLSQDEAKIQKVVGTEVTAGLQQLGDVIVSSAQQLTTATGQEADDLIRTVAGDLDLLLTQFDAAVGRLQTAVGNLDQHLVDDIHGELGKANRSLSNIFRISRVGFVSRESTFRARLPTLELTLDPTATHLLTFRDERTGQTLHNDSELLQLGVADDLSGVGTGTGIGAELVRVFLEAIFDAHEGLPAIAPANAGNLRSEGLLLNNVQPTGLSLGPWRLPLFQITPDGAIDAQDLGHMIQQNDQVALSTRLLVGRVISGVGPLNLNNPPLEALLAEAIATSVRKAVEKVTWCWYACGLDVEVAKAETDAEAAFIAALQKKEHKLERDIQDDATKASAWVQREAEKVSLRLRLHR